MRRCAGRSIALATIGALALTPALASANPPTPGSYRQDDGLGFRNILPPGQNGLATASDIITFRLDGTRPPHNNDQLDNYDTLAQLAPDITEPQVDQYFKDASFGIEPGHVASTYTPNCATVSAPSANSPHCDDVTIQRDSDWGVPHVYGADRAGLMFGAGYVAAQDRLFMMDAERHLGRAELSSFLGGSNIGTDRATWRSSPYTEDDLQTQYDNADDLYGTDGLQVQQDVQDYVDGINQYIAEARTSQMPMPGEYALALGDANGPDEWKVTDVVATASLVGGQFGKGGGGEVKSALVLEKAMARFGETEGRAAWEDFRERDDAEAPTTVHDTEFPYATPPATQENVSLPDPGTTVEEPVTVSPDPRKAPRNAPFAGLFKLDGLSNALLVSDAETEGDHPLAVMGPQVSYYSPQLLTEVDLHAPTTAEGPGIDARGVGFAGVSLYVMLGRGTDYAWSATSAAQDIADTYSLELCDPNNPADPGEMDDDGYRFEGSCLPFEVLEKTNTWEPNGADSTPPGSETLRSLRTKLGIVTHRALIGGKPSVYTQLRATYMHEADSAIGFAKYNQPSTMENVNEFKDSANLIDYAFNWFYADADDIGFFNSGANPVRQDDVDPNLPIVGDMDNTWQGFDPDTITFDHAPAAEHPQVVNQDYLTSWNNKQAHGYSAGDDNWAHGPIHRVQLLSDRVEADIAGSEQMGRAELVNDMEDAATVDLRGDKVLPLAVMAVKEGYDSLSKKKLDRVKDAVKTLKAWNSAGAHRIDRDEDGTYEDTKAIRIMDAWWPKLAKAEFKPELGEDLYNQILTVRALDDPPAAKGSAYIGGWGGYMSKDLRSVFGEPVDDPYSREYCGGGKKKECAKDLANSLYRAVKHKKDEEIYPGFPTTACNALATTPDAQWCNDSIRHVTLGAISQPPIDWQNRPTFQQVVESQGVTSCKGVCR